MTSDIFSHIFYGAIPSGQELEDIKMARRMIAARNITSLQKFSISVVFENRKLFLTGRQSENPFRKLPNALVQEFIALIAIAKDEVKYEMERKELKDLLCMLLNTYVTELELFSFHGNLQRDVMDKISFLNYALDNCPRMTKVVHYGETITLPLDCVIDYSRWNRWPDLQHLCILGLEFSDETFQLLHKQLPNLQTIVASFQNSAKSFTMAGAKFMSKFEKLELFEIHLGIFLNYEFEIFAHAAGKIPNLRELRIVQWQNHRVKINDHHRFVKVYGKYYPEKPVTVNNLSLSQLVQQDWPPNLHCEHLTLFEFDSIKAAEKITLIPHPVKSISFVNLPMDVLYFLISKFGPSIVHLEIFLNALGQQDPQTLINAHTIISSCPNAETVKLNFGNPVSEYYQLTPQHFTKCISLEYPQMEFFGYEGRGHLFSLFLLGSKVCRKLSLHAFNSRYAMSALNEDRTCLNKILELDISLHINDPEGSFDEAIIVAGRMLQTSPSLKRICFIDLGISPLNRRYCVNNIKDYILTRYGDTFVKFYKQLGVKVLFTFSTR